MAPRIKVESFNRSTEKFLGVSVAFIAIDIATRFAMIAVFLTSGTYVEKMVEIDPNIAYKYSYPSLEPAHQTVPIEKLGKLILMMAVTLFVCNHIVLQLLGSPSRIISVDAYHFIMSTTMSALSIATLAQCLKIWVARPRPDFLARCYPSGFDISQWKRVPECEAPLSDPIVNDGIQSFPSGHSASAWAASVYCFLYLREHYKAHPHPVQSRIPRCVPFLFAFSLAVFACYVSCTRLSDFQHHPEDIIAGGLLGATLTYLSFFLYYPLNPEIAKRPKNNHKGSTQNWYSDECSQPLVHALSDEHGGVSVAEP